MRIHARIGRFLAMLAWDLLLPDFIDIPLKLCQHFYTHFIATDPQEQLALLQEARSLSDAQLEEVTDALAAQWQSILPGGELTEPRRSLLRQLVLCLRQASQPAVADPAEALRESLNQSIMSPTRQDLGTVLLQPDQHAVGRSLIRAILGEKTAIRQPLPLPASVPPVPGYTLLRVLGQGGFSVVYLACHAATGEMRAVKVGPLVDTRRFQREVRLLGTLSGPHLVRYHEHGQLPGQFWIAMDYLGEYTLADLIRGRPSVEQALLLAEQVLRGLEALHQASIVHRDLKPENAMVDDAFRLRLIDYGLAKVLPGGAAAETFGPTVGLTGTPRYLSPEQICNTEDLDCAVDLWSFGCVLFELFTGRALFESSNVMALGHEIMTKELRLDDPAIPPEMHLFLGRCLQREPRDRWPNAGQALAEFLRGAAETRRRLRHHLHRESWRAVLGNGLLEQFAARHQGQLPADAVALFVALVRQEGIEDLDEEHLESILRPVFASQRLVFEAEQALDLATQQLRQVLTRVTAQELARLDDNLKALQTLPATCRHQLREDVEELLDELRRWEEKRWLAE